MWQILQVDGKVLTRNGSFDGDLCLHSNVEGLEDDSDVGDNGLEVDVLEEE